MKIFTPIMMAAALVVAVGCTPYSRVPVQRSQLQVRQAQTREFEVRDETLVMKAVLDALQDEGFVVKNAETSLGLITATKEVDVEEFFPRFMSQVIAGHEATWERSSVIEATMNVSRFGRSTRVRASFQKKVLDNRGGFVSAENIEDPQFYQNFFSKIDKSVFIQRERI